MPEGPTILRATSMLALACCALAGPAAAEKYDPNVLPRRGKDFSTGKLRGAFAIMPWEIKATFKHQDGHLGTFKVGDTIYVSFTVGVVGMRDSANTKNFRAPVPQVEIYEKDQRREIISMKPGAC